MNKTSIVVLVYIIGFVSGYGIFSFYKTDEQRVEIQPLRSGVIEQTTDSISVYKNTKHNFNLEYPNDLVAQEFDEGGDSSTIVFQKPGERVGFQIFITPYNEDQITEQRLRLDVSGEIVDPKEVVIADSVRALIFFSENSILGETREVWFIRDGYLFEVTTYKEQDEWISNILSTLTFE